MSQITQVLTREKVSSFEKKATKLIKNWYILYTRPRAEKVICEDLKSRGYEVFLPSVKTVHFWRNRQKRWIDEILFPNYVFVYTHKYQLSRINSLPKVVTFIHCGDKPSVIRSEDIDCIKRMLSLGDSISVGQNFSEGKKVKIIHGPLEGHQGILIKQKGKSRFGVRLKEINQMVLVDIDTKFLMALD